MFSIYLTQSDYEALRSSLFTKDQMENAAFALCGSANIGKDTRLFVRTVLPVPPDAYLERSAFHLEVSPKFINNLIDQSNEKLGLLMIHSHPGNLQPAYSSSDDFGERRLFEVAEDLLPKATHASLLFSSKGVRGRYWAKEEFRKVDRVRVVGRTIHDIEIEDKNQKPREEEGSIYHRQILAFGERGQKRITEAKVGIVGLGGTGSSVAEQLVRLGLGDLTLVDSDTFEPSNVTRMYGSTFSDTKSSEPKVRLVARHLREINPQANIKEINDTVIHQSVLIQLRDRDVIFCCTDTDWSRSVLNRFAYQYFIHTINLGMRIVVDDHQHIIGSAGRVTLVGNDLPCLLSLHRLSSERVRAESMSATERDKLVQEKYIEGLEVTGPAVISVNSAIASLAVTMFLGLLSDFTRVTSHASEQIYDVLEGIVFRSTGTQDLNCRVCGRSGLRGLGDSQIVSAYQ